MTAIHFEQLQPIGIFDTPKGSKWLLMENGIMYLQSNPHIFVSPIAFKNFDVYFSELHQTEIPIDNYKFISNTTA